MKITDFYSARQWHSTGIYCDYYRPLGAEHELQLCLPAAPERTAGPGRRSVRLYFVRESGPDFSERDRALIYQHSSDERQRKLADAIGEAARAALLKTATASGTHVAREASDQS